MEWEVRQLDKCDCARAVRLWSQCVTNRRTGKGQPENQPAAADSANDDDADGPNDGAANNANDEAEAAGGDETSTAIDASLKVEHPLSLIGFDEQGELAAAALCEAGPHGGKRVNCVVTQGREDRLPTLIDKAAFKLRASGVNACRFRSPDGGDPLRAHRAARWPSEA